MCIIVDANVRDIVFGKSRVPASELLLNSIDNRSHRLVIGGKLKNELMEANSFKNWLVQARLAQQIRVIPDDPVNLKADDLRRTGACKSDDEHVIALAQESGSRLLYTDDVDLQQDFDDRNLVANPRGRVYTTLRYQDVRRSHRDLLARSDLCAWSECGR